MDASERSYDAHDDGALLRLTAGGDARAWEILQARHASAVRSIATRLARKLSLEAEDLGQQVWVKVWGQCGRYRESGRFLGWVTRIARGIAVDEARRKGRKFIRAVGSLVAGLTAWVRGVDATDDVERVERVLKFLSKEEVALLRMYFWKGKTLKHIGGELGKDPSTVQRNLEKIYEKLRRRLEEEDREG